MKSAATNKTMAPIDPLQLLKALSPLLASDGGIKSVDEVVRLSSLMKKFSRKLVSRCVYVNVLSVSKPEAVEAFLQKGGWETIFQWLQEARERDNQCFLAELLRLYRVLPMTVGRLKENDSAKIIKTLMKSSSEDIRVLATDVVDSWFKLIKGDPNASLSTAGGDKALKKKKRPVKDEKSSAKSSNGSDKKLADKKRSKESTPKVPALVIKKEADTLKAVQVGAKSVEANHRNSNAKVENHRENNKKAVPLSKEDLEDVKLPDYIRLTAEPKSASAASIAATAATEVTELSTHRGVKGERKKSTVKMFHSKMRSIGLEEQPTPLPKLVIKKSSKDKSLILAPPKPLLKRPGLSMKEAGPSLPPLKKLKPPTLTLNVAPPKGETIAATDKTGKAESASPTTPPTATAAHDGAASVTEQQQQQLRREIKLIAPRPKPTVATHVLTESAGFMDALVAGPVQPVRKKKKVVGPPAATASGGSAGKVPTTPPSPVTSAPKLQFYKDTLEIQEETSAVMALAAASEADDKESAEEMSDSATADDQKCGSTSRKNSEEDNFTNRDTPLSPDSKDDAGCLNLLTKTISSRKKKQKRVSWADESNLKQVHYFELDETERVNVNNVKNFGDMKTLERLKERQVVESARRHVTATTEDRKPWLLIPIDLQPALITPGSNSLERDVQRLREDSVLQEIFFSKDSIPDAPHEADVEVVEPEETKIIPLIDENNPNAFADFSALELPAPVTSLPSALSNLVMSLSGKASTDVGAPSIYNPLQAAVEIPGLGELPPPHQMSSFPPGGPMGPMGPMGYHPMGPMGPMDFYNGPRGPMFPPNLGPGGMMNHHQGPMRGSGGRGGYGPMRGGNGPPRGGNGPYQQRGNYGSGGNQQNNQWNKGDRSKGFHGNGGGGNGGGGGGGGGSRARTTLCRHFVNGTCKYGENCCFLHPGINGPPL